MRDTSRIQQEEVEAVTGDFDDPDSLDAAMRDVDTVVLVSPAVATKKSRPSTLPPAQE